MASLKPCGTEAAHRRHLRRGEEPCHACYKAHEEYVRERRKKAKEQKFIKAEKTTKEPISLLDSYLENLGVVKAAMEMATPREIAALSKRRQELEEAIHALQNKSNKPAETISLIDEIAARRNQRLRLV